MKQTLFVLIAVLTLAACNNSSGWTTAQKNEALKSCMDEVQGKTDDATAKKYCSCVLDKMMQKYPTYAEANKNGTQEEGMKIGMACATELKLNKGNNDDNGGINGGLGNGLGGGNEGKWSDADEQKFMNTCLQNARNAGADDQTSNTHCNCTLKKIEAKYSSWDEANRKMTKAEVDAIEQECIQERNNGDN